MILSSTQDRTTELQDKPNNRQTDTLHLNRSLIYRSDVCCVFLSPGEDEAEEGADEDEHLVEHG